MTLAKYRKIKSVQTEHILQFLYDLDAMTFTLIWVLKSDLDIVMTYIRTITRSTGQLVQKLSARKL